MLKKSNIMKLNKPSIKPNNPNFSSGPTTKRPGWTTKHLEFALLGRSHRSPDCKARLKEVIKKSRNILSLPKGYLLGIKKVSTLNEGELSASISIAKKNYPSCPLPK